MRAWRRRDPLAVRAASAAWAAGGPRRGARRGATTVGEPSSTTKPCSARSWSRMTPRARRAAARPATVERTRTRPPSLAAPRQSSKRRASCKAGAAFDAWDASSGQNASVVSLDVLDAAGHTRRRPRRRPLAVAWPEPSISGARVLDERRRPRAASVTPARRPNRSSSRHGSRSSSAPLRRCDCRRGATTAREDRCVLL